MVKKKGISQRIENAQLLINGALGQPAVSQELAKVGYPKKEIEKGRALLNKVIELQTAKTTKYGLQLSTSEEFKQEQATAWEKYIYHVQSARLAFRNDVGRQKRLQLNVSRQRTIAVWMEQARFFYQEIRQMSDQFAVMGVTDEELAQTQAMIEAMSSARQHYKSLIGEAQMATQQRNAALKDLDVWVRKFTKVARIALEEQDQLLEGMGLLVRSKG